MYTYILPETLKELQLCTHIHVGTYDATGAAVDTSRGNHICYIYANEHSAPPMDGTAAEVNWRPSVSPAFSTVSRAVPSLISTRTRA